MGWEEMSILKQTTTTTHIFTQKDIKDRLGMDGDIASIELWSGRSPYDVESNIGSPDGDKYAFVIRQKICSQCEQVLDRCDKCKTMVDDGDAIDCNDGQHLCEDCMEIDGVKPE
jgi:hypothetical protein